ncbi:hypothetical protein DVH24_000275 [Malus domestica]|uniref:Uncharacterized protein n=1 Tax=Malus domestica TaxID=3750 RepID=A0A498J066_MALDO|nr:hypothetical protein DVH24_000275 [Malus domestica]
MEWQLPDLELSTLLQRREKATGRTTTAIGNDRENDDDERDDGENNDSERDDGERKGLYPTNNPLLLEGFIKMVYTRLSYPTA